MPSITPFVLSADSKCTVNKLPGMQRFKGHSGQFLVGEWSVCMQVRRNLRNKQVFIKMYQNISVYHFSTKSRHNLANNLHSNISIWNKNYFKIEPQNIPSANANVPRTTEFCSSQQFWNLKEVPNCQTILRSWCLNGHLEIYSTRLSIQTLLYKFRHLT